MEQNKKDRNRLKYIWTIDIDIVGMTEQWGKTVFSKQSTKLTGYSCGKKMNINLYLTPYTDLYSIHTIHGSKG